MRVRKKKISGGRIAISGFDYQAIVILDQLFDHFDLHPVNARARAEGKDDLDLIWTENGHDLRCHVQIKKPRETVERVPKNKPWQLSEVARELLPNTLDQLIDSDSYQIWVLGDPVHSQVRRLVAAGSSAASQEAGLYWSVVHQIARAEVFSRLSSKLCRSLRNWRFKNPPHIPNDSRQILITTYSQLLSTENVDAEVIRGYQERVLWIDQRLPGVLARVKIKDDYGSEETVGQRFQDRLQHEYGLPPDVVKHSLFGNFRSFINDVAKRPDEMINRQSFEAQLRSAWPQMSAATEPPAPPENSILRLDLTEALIKPESATVIEVVGISGSGKTTLAAHAAVALADYDPGRLPIYVRVRADATFRDVISGISFYLLRRGMPELFGLAVDSQPADETVIERLAEICSGLLQPVLLLLDLAEGTCNTHFGRDLGRFARALRQGACRLVVLGQQSNLSALSPIETDSTHICSVNMRGFSGREFISLVNRYHSDADSTVLWNIFNSITVGRPSGLYAQLAEALARQSSVSAMVAIAKRVPEDMVSAAEQSRFDQLGPGVRSAAEHLVCFALPFRRHDAETAFPDENVGAAVKALVDLGLLRIVAEGLLEMHETVRAGLEAGIAKSLRQKAHVLLAQWYAGQGDIAAQIFHLDKAGRSDEAKHHCREAFLRGEAWRSIASYVTRHKLVTVKEIINIVARPEPIADVRFLEFILYKIAQEGEAVLLMDLLAQQRSRYFSDYNWASTIVEAILKLNPSLFENLLEFTVVQAENAEQYRQGLTRLLIVSRRGRRPPTFDIVNFTKSQPEDIQRLFLPDLLLERSKTAFELAFAIYSRPIDEKMQRDAGWYGLKLTVNQREDAVEILAALPTQQAGLMIATRSLAFGKVGSLIWEAKRQLRPFCIDLLKESSGAIVIMENALRVLLLIGYSDIEKLVDPLAPGPLLQDYALLGPAFAPTAYAAGRYEVILLDPSASAASRQTALAVLFFLNADLGLLRHRLTTLPRDPLAVCWDSLFVIFFARKPFIAGISILQDQLLSSSMPQLSPALLVSCLAAVAEKAWPGVTDLLICGLQHANGLIRRDSIKGLARHRSLSALGALKSQLSTEQDAKTVIFLVEAVAASGPASVADLAAKAPSPEVTLWNCIVAMRTRDESYAPQLVDLATDPSQPWMVRRAAIWAAGRLPYTVALQIIVPKVLAERTPLTIDHNENLQVHYSLNQMVKIGIAQFLLKGKASFVAFVSSELERQWSDLIIKGELPSPNDAALWLYTRLIDNPSPFAIQQLFNQMHIPLLQVAVVRALRISGRAQDIENILGSTSSIWLAMKCLQELRWGWGHDPDLRPRLYKILAESPCNGAVQLTTMVEKININYAKPLRKPSILPANELLFPERIMNTILDYSTAASALRGTSVLKLEEGKPVALLKLSREEVQKLIALAEAASNRGDAPSRLTPKMTFTANKHTVVESSWTSQGGDASIVEQLKPAIAAANRFELPMHWHDEYLKWPYIDRYGKQFIASLGAQGDGDRLFQVLDSNADILLPFLGKQDGLKVVRSLLDERLVPVLHRCLPLGDDDFFEILCNLVQQVSSEKAVPVLAGLLARWASRFNTRSPIVQAENIQLWRGFKRLGEHPRFYDVPDWRIIVEKVMDKNIDWFRKQEIMQMIENDPSSYVTIERELLQEENWHHFRICRINRLDEAAENLFSQVR